MTESIPSDRNPQPLLPIPPRNGNRKASKALTASLTVKANRKARRGLSARQKAAIGAATVGTGLLTLSIAHLTESITLLTGSHWCLSALLAVGIDAGLLVSEWASLATKDHGLRRWAHGYVAAAVVMSCGLNAYAFAQHAPAALTGAAAALGVVIPCLVLALGKVAGRLWLER